MSLHSLGLISDATMRAHRARWFVYADGHKIPHTATMRGRWPGWDVTCSCGWQSCTGGGIRRYVADMLDDHRLGLR